MTNNHLLIYRLAELMLEKQQHIIALDDLFEDEQIGSFVRSIQIDSPYQQLIFEGVLTETIKEERVMVTFTVEGYFHYVLGEVIEQQSEGKGAEVLKELLENNKLRGITEGVEQYLVRDVEKNDLSRLMWFIDKGGKALEASAYPLAQAFLIHPTEKVMDELLADPTDNDVEALEKAIDKLEEAKKNEAIKNIYLHINQRIKPSNPKKGILFVKSIEYIEQKNQNKSLINLEKKLDKFNLKRKEEEDIVFLLGKRFDSILEYDKAIKYYKRSIELNIKMYGNKHNSIGFTNNFLGIVFMDKGEYDKAIDHYEKGLEIIGKKHSFSKNIYSNLGTAWRHKSEYDKSIKFSHKALELALKINGKYHDTTSTIYNNIGVVYSDMANYTKAEEYYKKALKIRRKLYGEMNSNISVSYNNLGTICNNKGEYDKAIEYHEKSLAIDLKVHGEEHPSTATTYNNLGSAWEEKEEYDKAIEYYEKSLAIKLKVYGDQHPSTAICYSNLGIVWEDKGGYDKAIEYYEKSLAIDVKINGEQNSETGLSYFYAADAYLKLKKFKKALDYFKKGFISNQESGGFPFKIAICYENLNQLEEATKNYCLSAEIRKKVLGIEDDSTQKAIQEAIRLAKENNIKLLPDWIKKIANDQ